MAERRPWVWIGPYSNGSWTWHKTGILYDSSSWPTYINKGAPYRGKVFHVRLREPGDEPLVECGPYEYIGPPKPGQMLAHCPKGFNDVYLIDREDFARWFEVTDA